MMQITRFRVILIALMALACPFKTAANGLLGDVNGDKTTSISDVTELISHVLSGNVAVVAGKTDVNFDGVVNIRDVTTLIQLVLSDTGKKTFVVDNVLFSLIPVEGGTFTMGSSTPLENPAHKVTVSSYYIGETEVTRGLWNAVMNGQYADVDLPINNKTWEQCNRFITKLSALTGFEFRMPTEAEWEYAARGGNKSQSYTYAGSNSINNVAWYSGNSGNQLHTVAQLAPNELGLFDMSGNVREWCSDIYAEYSSAAQTDPTGPSEDEVINVYRITRGGAYTLSASTCTVTVRSSLQQTNSAITIGMRLAIVLD